MSGLLGERGIITDLFGGLGNGMFIIAGGHVTSRIQKCPFYIPYIHPEKNPHNHMKRDYRENIFRNFGVKLDMHVDTARSASIMSGHNYFTNGAFSRWDPSTIRPGTFVNSYFQYYPPFAAFEDELRYMFLSGIQEYRKRVLERVGSKEVLACCAFLHIRRGDYLKHPTIHYNQTLEYYEKAVNRLCAEADAMPEKIYVISDDIAWVKSQPFFTANPIYDIFDSADELETMAFMSLCTAGAVCANSTFSWWGAFLGAYGARCPVIVPSKWISEPVESLFPSEWIAV